jgi:hypothetical protein
VKIIQMIGIRYSKKMEEGKGKIEDYRLKIKEGRKKVKRWKSREMEMKNLLMLIIRGYRV